MLNKIARYIEENALLAKGERYVVGLSGGADSVALAMILQQLGYDIEAAHCNFRLRKSESDRDEDFCKRFCEQRAIPFHIARFDTETYAQFHKISIEMAARALRYNYFEQLRKDLSAHRICVAHHADDSVETILLNMIRGTGIKGLTGIKPLNALVARPLLCCSRRELEDFVRQNGQDFVTDSTNLQLDPIRNRIRLQLLPMIERINPSAREAISKMGSRLLEAQKIIDRAIAETSMGSSAGKEPTLDAPLRFPLDEISRFPSPEYLLHHILAPLHFTPAQTEQIALAISSPAVGKTWKSTSYELLLDRDALLLAPLETSAPKEMTIPEPNGIYRYSETTTLRLSVLKYTPGETSIPREPNAVMLDAANIKFPLTLRRAQAADRFVPLGMKGSKLVSDYLTDIKKTIFDKRRQLVLLDATGTVLWLVGRRLSELFRITNRTQNAMLIMLNSDRENDIMPRNLV